MIQEVVFLDSMSLYPRDIWESGGMLPHVGEGVFLTLMHSEQLDHRLFV